MIRKIFTSIYRSGLMLCFVLSISCKDGRCIDNHSKCKSLLKSNQPLLGPQVSLDENNTTQLKNIKKLIKRFAKVKENQQAIVLMHGLHRVPYDFYTMIATLKRMFPHAIILPLENVSKNLSNKEAFSFSPSVDLSIREQASLAYEEIKKKIPRGSHVVLVGHSQGGLRGFTLAQSHRNRLSSNDGIVIHRLITIGTPWKGAPIMEHIKNIKNFNQKFKNIKPALDTIQKNYSEAVRGYFFKFLPSLSNMLPSLYETIVPYFVTKQYQGVADLEPNSKFISEYVASSLKEVDLPITAIACILTDFSKLFEPFPSSIGLQSLAELNANYAELIGGDPKCEHDMLLPVATQHAEGLVKKNFNCIKVYGACHGNKVGVSVKRGLSALNNEQVIQKVVESIEEVFYEQREDKGIETE